MCSACAMGKSKKKSHKPKSEDTNQEKFYLLHMDLCGPMRVESVNGKKYILVTVDDYSRFTWVKCLRSKDEAPDFIIKFLKIIQVRLKVSVRRIRTDNGTKFVNQTLREYYEQDSSVALTAFADADHAGCQDTRRSTSDSLTMDTMIDQQVAMDEALVPHARRLRIERSNFLLLSDISSNGAIRRLTDVNINKLHQPWRSFAAIINKCLTGKSSSYDSLRLSQAQILWGLYHKRNVDFAYLIWEDFVYQVEHKDIKKSTEMYDPRFTKFGALLPIELTNADIRNSDAYKEYYAVATGATPPKPKASVRKTRSSFDTIVTPPNTAAGPRLSTFAKGKQPATTSKAKNEGTGTIPVVLDVPTDDSEEEISWNSTDEEGDDNYDDEGDDGEEGNDDDDQEEETRDEESFDPILKTPENTDDEGYGEENLGMNVGKEEGQDEEDEEDELYRDVNINLGRGIQMGDVHMTQEFKDSHVTLTPVNPDGQQQSSSTTSQMDVQTPTSVAPLLVSAPTLTHSIIATITITQQAPTPLATALGTLLQDLPNFGSLFGFDHRLKTLEANFSEFMQTNQFAGAVSSIPGIVQRNMDQRMNEAVKVAVQIQSDRLRDEAQAENDEFLKTIDENMQKIIKEQVKEQVKVQVSKILPKIEQTVNEQLEAEVLTRSSNSSKTSYVVAADLSEMELKKILIEKIEGNKFIHRSDEQRNLYKALVEAYESDKIILDTYGDTITLKRRRGDDADKDEEPSAGSDRGSKRRREGKEPESASAPKEKATRSYDKHALWGISHWGRKRQQFYVFAVNRESARDVYSKRRIIAVTELKIVERYNYKHLDWITVRRDDDKLYKFKEGDFKRLRIQDIEDMLLLLVQGKLTNLTVEERFAFNPEPEGSTQGYLLVSVEVLRYDKRSKSENIGIVPTEMELIPEHTQQGISHEVSGVVGSEGKWQEDVEEEFTEASADESMLWHKRLGHLNFKTMNKLVRHNLVKGLPSKCFENDHTCVACLKGKQHKASCKTKLVNSVSKPLHTLHMDLFGPTSISSLNHKWYCLVVTDDFSREMNEFYTKKGIKREFNNDRTLQQNRVAKRRNRTLIEAARTMLADDKLPVTFWAEAVNTAC
nr:putative ribonuclease H-like domain-containing protein [Tanacetum cinerariifolium]